MNSSLKDVEFLYGHSESSPSFKNLRIDSDSPTVTNKIHQILNSQNTNSNNPSPSSETQQLMNMTGTFKSCSQFVKKESGDSQRNDRNNENNNHMQPYSSKKDDQKQSSKQGKSKINEKNGQSKQSEKQQTKEKQLIKINTEKEQPISQNGFTGSAERKPSIQYLQSSESENNEMQIQNSTDQSMHFAYESSGDSKNQSNSQGIVSRQNSQAKEIQNRNIKSDVAIQLDYVYNKECKYNPVTNNYSGNCSLHNQEIINFMCFTCTELICNECVNIHLGHQVQTIKTSYQICKKSIQQSLEALNNKIEKLLLYSEDLTSIQNDIIEVFQQQKHEIQRSYKSIVQGIKNMTKQLFEYCSEMYNEKYEHIIKQHESLRKGLSKLIESHRVIEKSIVQNDQFITCDYYVKKCKLINSLLNNQNNEGNHSSSFSNFDKSIQNYNIYNVFPPNCALNVNDQRITQYLEREFLQLKLNLGKSQLEFQLPQNFLKDSQAEEERNTGRFNADSNFISPISSRYKNTFKSLQSSPQNKYLQNDLDANIIPTFQNNQQETKQKEALPFLDYQKAFLKKQMDMCSNKYQPFQIANQKEPMNTNKSSKHFIEDRSPNHNIFLSPQQNDKYYQLDNSQISQDNSLINVTIPTNSFTVSQNMNKQNGHQDRPELKKIYGDAKVQQQSNKKVKPTSLLSQSPNRPVTQDEKLSNQKQISVQNKEFKPILSSPASENPLSFLSSDKADKETMARDSMTSNKQFSEVDCRSSMKHSQKIDVKNELFSSNKIDHSQNYLEQQNTSNSVFTNTFNNESRNDYKFNKDIEEIKQILYKDSFQQKRQRCLQLTQNTVRSDLNQLRDTLQATSFSVNHSPNRETPENSFFQSYLNINFPQSSKQIGLKGERTSPNFFNANSNSKKQNYPSINAIEPNSKIQDISYQNTKTTINTYEKFKNSQFQLEGFLNSIRNQDKIVHLGNNSDNQNIKSGAAENNNQLIKSRPNLTPINCQSKVIDISSNLSNQSITSRPQKRSISNYQPYESLLAGNSKERLANQILQNLIHSRVFNNNKAYNDQSTTKLAQKE